MANSRNPGAKGSQGNWRNELEEAINKAELGDKKALHKLLIKEQHGCFSREFGEMSHVVEFEVDPDAVPVREDLFR